MNIQSEEIEFDRVKIKSQNMRRTIKYFGVVFENEIVLDSR